MPLYEVSIARSFMVKIQAQTAQDAAKLTQSFLGGADDSNEWERKKYEFEFKEIELVDNDVMEVNRIEN